MEAVSKESDQTGESKQAWRRPLNSRIGPLALGLHSQMCATLLKRDFSTPAFHEIGHDGYAGLGLIRREVGSCIPFSDRDRVSEPIGEVKVFERHGTREPFHYTIRSAACPAHTI